MDSKSVLISFEVILYPYIGNMDMNKGVISDQKTKKAKKTKHFLEK